MVLKDACNKIEAKVDGLGVIYSSCDSSFDNTSKILLEKSDGIITLRDLAYARINDAKANGGWENSSLSKFGSYVREGSLFVPHSDNKRVWIRRSLVLKNPELAVKAHLNDKEYTPKNFKAEKYLEEMGKNNYYILDSNDLRLDGISTNRFSEFGSMHWAFGDQTKKYGLFLQDAGIPKIDIWMYAENDYHINIHSKPFANQLYINSLKVGSYIRGDAGKNLHLENLVRGLRTNVIIPAKKELVKQEEYG